jgi:hypothetical protein
MRSEVVRASVIGLLSLSLLVAGCAPIEEQPSPTISTTPTPTVTPEPDPELVEGGTAGQNRPFFEFVLTGMLERNPEPTSQTVVNSLVSSGFDKTAMQVTADTTPVGERADSILVSVLIDGQCLIGQVIDAELSTELADVLGTGRCLIGDTLSIDW